jgi:hypothetical protein
MKTHLTVGAIVVGLAGLGFFFWTLRAQAPTAPPTVEEELSNTQVDARMGVRADALGVGIEVREVLEDSRCPAEVQCIWAGTVRVRTVLYTASGSGSAPQEFTLGQPITTETREVELVAVRQAARAGEALPPGDYEFVFEVRARDL